MPVSPRDPLANVQSLTAMYERQIAELRDEMRQMRQDQEESRARESRWARPSVVVDLKDERWRESSPPCRS